MKVAEFYLNDISQYDDISEYLRCTIEDKFYGIGKNSISISRFTTYIKKALKTYIKLKYDKTVSVIITFTSSNEKIVSNDNKNIVRLRVSYDVISGILNGDYPLYSNFINELLDQLETELNGNTFKFNEYLALQMNSLTTIAAMELKSNYSSSYLQKNIVKKESWIKLSEKSSVFNDYYKAYMENSISKESFYAFLKSLVKII